VGYGLLFDPLLDYHLLTISSSSHCKLTELTLPTLPSISPNLLAPAPAQSRQTTKPASYLAFPFPDDTPFRSPSRRALSGLRIPHSILREKDPLSTEALKVLGDVTVRVRYAVGSVVNAGEGLRRRYPHFRIEVIVGWNFNTKTLPFTYQSYHPYMQP
jgi:hypothetical protein